MRNACEMHARCMILRAKRLRGACVSHPFCMGRACKTRARCTDLHAQCMHSACVPHPFCIPNACKTYAHGVALGQHFCTLRTTCGIISLPYTRKRGPCRVSEATVWAVGVALGAVTRNLGIVSGFLIGLQRFNFTIHASDLSVQIDLVHARCRRIAETACIEAKNRGWAIPGIG